MSGEEPEKRDAAESPQPVRLLAFHVSEGCDRYTTLGGVSHIPALVYEVVEAEEDSSPVYEGRILDSATGAQIHERPYQSTFLGAFSIWWERETGTEPPPELLHGAQADRDPDERSG